MDRPVSETVRRRRRIRAGALTLGAAALGVIVAAAVLGWMRPTVRRDRIRTARVERGAVEATVSAAGTVVPLYEHLVTSPVDTRVMRRLVAPGDTVVQGEPVVLLDVGATELALQRLEDQIALKRNERERARARARGAPRRAAGAARGRGNWRSRRRSSRRRAIANITTRGSSATTTCGGRRRRPSGTGSRCGGSTRRSPAPAGSTRRGSTASRWRSRSWTRTARRRRSCCSWRGPRPSAAAWSPGWWRSEGTAVRRGDPVARIADLSAFGVEATLSDVHATRVHVGQPVTVVTGETRLAGRVGAVRPTVENGLLTLEIALDEPAHPALRNHLRVDVHVVTDRHEETLRVARGSFLNLDGRAAVFVVRGDVVRRSYVELGLASFETFEVTSGLAEGDEVVLSDMSDHRDLEEVRLK